MRKVLLLILALVLVMVDCGPPRVMVVPTPPEVAPHVEGEKSPDVRFNHDCPFFGDYCKDRMVWGT